MDICRILVISVLSTTILSSNIESLNSKSYSQNSPQNIDCKPDQFRAYQYPALKGNLDEVCVKCECLACENFIGCTVCQPNFFMIYENGAYVDRSYTVCLECDKQCVSGFCTDRNGCSKCNPDYESYVNPLKDNKIRQCRIETPTSSSDPQPKKKDDFNVYLYVLIFIGFILSIAILSAIIVCIINKKKRNGAHYRQAPLYESLQHDQQEGKFDEQSRQENSQNPDYGQDEAKEYQQLAKAEEPKQQSQRWMQPVN